MKKVWNFIKPSLIMFAGFGLSFLLQSIIGAFINENGTPGALNTVLTAVGCAVIIMLLSISVDMKKSKFGLIPVIIFLIIFAVLNIMFVGYDTISYTATICNWEFSLIRMMWYDMADYWLKNPLFTIEYEILINASSIVASVAVVVSAMLLGSLIHKKKNN